MLELSNWLQQVLGISAALQTRIVLSLIYIAAIWIGRRVFLRVFVRDMANLQARYRWQKAVDYSGFVLGVFFVGRLWIEGIDSLATYLGLVSAGLAIALQELVVSIAGWLFILWRRPFQLGDRIQIGDHTGDVIDTRIFQFTLQEVGNWVDADQTTGRVIHIPNGKVFTESLANYGQAFRYIWNEIPVRVTFESNWRKAKAILQRVVAKHTEQLTDAAAQRIRDSAKQFMVFHTNLTPSVYTTVGDSGVLLTMRYLCEPYERRDTTEAIWEEVLDLFAAESDIDFAYPTQREVVDEFNNRASSTKPQALAVPKPDTEPQRSRGLFSRRRE